jgi:hypothetical protein
VTIGRGRHCDVSLYSSLLSREHARVRWQGGEPVIFDLESLNGCFVGPDRIQRHALKPDDVIRLGDVQLQFRQSEIMPAYEPESGMTPVYGTGLEKTPVDFEPGSETRFFSRTAALHQKVFDYDELFWLLEFVEALQLTGPVRDSRLVEDVEGWRSAFPDRFWVLLRIGLLRPKDLKADLTGCSAGEMAAACRLTKRGERLRTVLEGGRAHWNEMASLRYQVRQGRIFKPLRAVARAYRPGGGVRALNVGKLLDELQNIYAPTLGATVLESEFRRLLCLGFFAPSENTKGAAWYPVDFASWESGEFVVIAERGYAMLEGFRLEE